jgi:hypothetical protein
MRIDPTAPRLGRGEAATSPPLPSHLAHSCYIVIQHIRRKARENSPALQEDKGVFRRWLERLNLDLFCLLRRIGRALASLGRRR